MHELKLSREARHEINMALIGIDAIVGDDITVTIILHSRAGGIFTITNEWADDLEVRFTDDLLNVPK